MKKKERLHDVVIVGGGPVGLFLGLNLARQGIETLVLEADPDIVSSPRALMYYPIVLHEFKKLGILDEVVEAGYKNEEGLCFRTPASGTNEVLAKIPPGKAPEGEIDYGVQLRQPKLTGIIRKHALQCPSFSLEYNSRFVGLQQEEDYVTLETEDVNGQTVYHTAQFVVGCDGASSSVRKDLNIPFEGFTWEDWRFLAINIKYDFDKHGYPAANHVIDPEDWAVIVRASHEKEGIWRIATGIDPDIPIEEIEKHVPAKLEKLLPGPRPLNYEILGVSPYWAHERVAKTWRSGRVVLCGDAAHVCNPLTAMGLTTGLVDVAYLSRLLPQAFAPTTASTWPKLLEKYEALRRKDVVECVQKQTIEGKLRMHSQDRKVVAERNDFFNMLNKNPGFGMFVASTMTKKVPDNLSPSFL
ncbi:FAD/NAD(P)-binding domain-containing protein [Plenodomus tracheiphilus IPT5]|uniref:FAD/NAD(P)-binding domain-containing protein n=1 Tax=Plenodomus tracheiphilus IPT5 TaxID=1408161 RepID=A0A6A7B0X4_9PLEO|nr:FAD/NAD(P)-binding domain-containing protein [Plenodomus tracheiphilus IPT5]